MKKTSIIIAVLTLFSLSAFSQSPSFFLELSSGYNFGFSEGWTYHTYGSYDSTLTYEQESNVNLGNSGLALSGKIGFIVSPDFTILAGVSYVSGSKSFNSAQAIYTSGSVAYNYTNNFNWSMLQISPGIRFSFIKVGAVEFFGGVGLLIGVPLSFKNSYTCDNPIYSGKTGTSTYTFDPGLGAYSELGMEYKINNTFGISLSTTVDKLSMALNKYEAVDLSGVTYTSIFVDNPQNDNNGQTAADVKKSTADHIYYTYPKFGTDFSDLSLKLALTIRL
jgi:hypothetical protein